jgi:agmatine deiminase
MADNRARLVAAGLDVVDFPILAAVEVEGEPVAVSHLNLYLCNGAAIVPLAGVDSDAEALERIAAAYPDREVVGVPGRVIAYGGGGPHCITQQVPAAG